MTVFAVPLFFKTMDISDRWPSNPTIFGCTKVWARWNTSLAAGLLYADIPVGDNPKRKKRRRKTKTQGTQKEKENERGGEKKDWTGKLTVETAKFYKQQEQIRQQKLPSLLEYTTWLYNVPTARPCWFTNPLQQFFNLSQLLSHLQL